MQIVQKKIKDLIPAEYNPRRLTKEQGEHLKRSLQNFDIVEPAVINTHKDRKNIIIGGHQRIKIAKQLKYKEFPCVEVNLPLEKEQELNIRLNKNTGEFDFDILANNFDVLDLVDWGFDFDDFGMDGEPDPGLTDDDTTEIIDESSIGHLWLVDEHKILYSDDIELIKEFLTKHPPENLCIKTVEERGEISLIICSNEKN